MQNIWHKMTIKDAQTTWWSFVLGFLLEYGRRQLLHGATRSRWRRRRRRRWWRIPAWGVRIRRERQRRWRLERSLLLPSSNWCTFKNVMMLPHLFSAYFRQSQFNRIIFSIGASGNRHCIVLDRVSGASMLFHGNTWTGPSRQGLSRLSFFRGHHLIIRLCMEDLT